MCLSASLAVFECLAARVTAGPLFGYSINEVVERTTAVLLVYLVSTIGLWSVVYGLSAAIPKAPRAAIFVYFATLSACFTVAFSVVGGLNDTLEWWTHLSGILLLSSSVATVVALVFHFKTRRGAFAGRFQHAFFVVFAVALSTGAADLAYSSIRAYRDGANTAGEAAWASTAIAAVTLSSLYFVRLPRRRWLGAGLPIAVLTIFAFGPAAWNAQPVRPVRSAAAASKSTPVILITVDTLRRDAVSTYSAESGVTSHMDRIGREGFVFEHAFASAPWTLPSIASLMTGLSYRVHGATTVQSTVAEGFETLAECFQAAGYRTAAIGDNLFLSSRSNVDQGFDEYDWHPRPAIRTELFASGFASWLVHMPFRESPSTSELTDRAIRWIEARPGDTFFLWLHYFDPHLPYAPPAPYVDDENTGGFGAVFDDLKSVRSGTVGATAEASSEEREWIRSLYDGEVRYVDDNVGRLLDRLEALGLYDRSLIVLTSDHGEEFWDHGGFEHGHSLYNELIEVPLLIKPPGQFEGGRIAANVGLVDLKGTVLDLADAPYSTSDPSVNSFSTLMDDQERLGPDRTLFSGATLYGGEKEGIIFADSQKLIVNKEDDTVSLYDLKTDPHERHSLDSERPETVAHGLSRLAAAANEAIDTQAGLNIRPGRAKRLTPAEAEALESVGYIE